MPQLQPPQPMAPHLFTTVAQSPHTLSNNRLAQQGSIETGSPTISAVATAPSAMTRVIRSFGSAYSA